MSTESVRARMDAALRAAIESDVVNQNCSIESFTGAQIQAFLLSADDVSPLLEIVERATALRRAIVGIARDYPQTWVATQTDWMEFEKLCASLDAFETLASSVAARLEMDDETGEITLAPTVDSKVAGKGGEFVKCAWIPDPKPDDPIFGEWEASGEPSFFKWLAKRKQAEKAS